jgi:hypothetical protein
MKVCYATLLLLLGTGGHTTLGAQPVTPLLMASDAIPADLLLPGTHLEISQAAPTVLEAPEPRHELTRMDRFTLFLNDTYASPGAYAGLGAGAMIDQVRHVPAKWDADGSAYTRRFASEYGQLAIRNSVHDGMAALTGLDPRYAACTCAGLWRRSGHALERTFVNRRQDGRVTLDVPQIAGAYSSGMLSTYWYPHHQFTPLVQGVQFGHEQMGEILINNLVQEFGSDLKRSLHLHALAALSHPRPDDDE